jgi:hypothetical protein
MLKEFLHFVFRRPPNIQDSPGKIHITALLSKLFISAYVSQDLINFVTL